jgi:hypothetical protein
MDLSSDDELDDLSDDELDDLSDDELDALSDDEQDKSSGNKPKELSHDELDLPLEEEDLSGSDSVLESEPDGIDEGDPGLDSCEIFRRFPGKKHRDRRNSIAERYDPWVLMKQSPVYPLIQKWNLKSAKMMVALKGNEDLPKLFNIFLQREKARGNNPRLHLKVFQD